MSYNIIVEPVVFSFELKNQVIAPKDGYVLMVRFKHPHHAEYDSVFCEHASLQNGVLQLRGCRNKRLLLDSDNCVPQEYSTSLGHLPVTMDYTVQLYQVPVPMWFQLNEADAQTLQQHGATAGPIHTGFQDWICTLLKSTP